MHVECHNFKAPRIEEKFSISYLISAEREYAIFILYLCICVVNYSKSTKKPANMLRRMTLLILDEVCLSFRNDEVTACNS